MPYISRAANRHANQTPAPSPSLFNESRTPIVSEAPTKDGHLEGQKEFIIFAFLTARINFRNRVHTGRTRMDIGFGGSLLTVARSKRPSIFDTPAGERWRSMAVTELRQPPCTERNFKLRPPPLLRHCETPPPPWARHSTRWRAAALPEFQPLSHRCSRHRAHGP